MLDKMAFFVYVIRTGSISAASRHFNLSVSAGSRWLQELENHFGVPLCHRSNRLLTATQAGQTLFDEFSPLVDNAERISRKLEDFQASDKGHINIAVTPVYANHFLIDKIADYMTENPDVTFNLNVTPWALDHASECDLMISANASFQGYREKDLLLVKREVMQCPFIVVASPEYLQRHGEPLHPQDLTQHHCLFARTLTGSNDWIFRQDAETLQMKVPKSVEVNDSDLLLKAALKSTGIAYLPQFVVEEAISHKSLVPLMEDYETSIWSLNLYYHPPQKASPLVTRFKDFLLGSTGSSL
ncbi:LysR family transcriptional regulator [Vibrio coralliilyticus]|jgi:DNA-binding transcriptional LysR family regulator|uniref:LysR family transcriptional regulator n=1 Tax=Vibrio TaxID=662 RepID=UPI000507D7A7|nr:MULTISPECIES: LysR family transcriptional regulator [Vibrio]KFI10414.1 transcriptional regulator [Vibrio sp. B183]NOI16721.1 LysR family transcriptional regulator [Vibrio coralliilyticus]